MTPDAKDVPTFDVLRAVIASDPYHQQFQPLLDHIATLTRERDALRKVYEAAEDFIGAQGTAYEADQYLMLCGVVRDYNARTADAGGA
jgi:hypothetical protein